MDRSEIAVKFTSNVSVKTDPRSVIVYEKLPVPRHRTARSVAVTQMAATRASVVVDAEARKNVESIHTTTDCSVCKYIATLEYQIYLIC